MKQQRFTKSKAIKIAKNYKTQQELRKGCPDLYYWAQHHKVLHWFKPFMMGLFKHTKKSAFKIAKQYNAVCEFREQRRDVVSFLKRQGFFDEATKHMTRKKEFYSFDILIKSLKKYKYWDELKKENFNLYIFAKKIGKNKLIPKYIKERGHPKSWNKAMVIYEMNKYKSKTKLLKFKPAAYQRAISLGLIKQNFDPITGNRIWNKQTLLALCKKYKTFGDLVINEGNSPLNAAKKLGIKLPLIHTMYSGEVYLHHFLEKITGLIFKKARPNFLKNPKTGRNLELDGFNYENKVAFEHCGAFHSKPDTKKRDQLKRKLCDKNNIKVIYIDDIIYFYKMNENKIKEELIYQLKKLNIPFDQKKLMNLTIFNKIVKRRLIANNSKIAPGWSRLKRST